MNGAPAEFRSLYPRIKSPLLFRVSYGGGVDSTATLGTPVQLAPGQRVRWVGIHGRGDGLRGRVSRVLRAGVRVRWDDGRVEVVHPEDVRPIA